MDCCKVGANVRLQLMVWCMHASGGAKVVTAVLALSSVALICWEVMAMSWNVARAAETSVDLWPRQAVTTVVSHSMVH